jgi:hypothetical protein
MKSVMAARENSFFHFIPGEARRRIVLQVLLTPIEFLLLPVMDRYVLRIRREIVPKIFDELELLGRAQLEHGPGIHFVVPCVDRKSIVRENDREPHGRQPMTPAMGWPPLVIETGRPSFVRYSRSPSMPSRR